MTRKRLGNFSNRANDDESKKNRKDRYYDLAINQKKRQSEIQSILGVGRTTLFNIRNELVKEGKIVLTKSGHVKKSEQQKTSETFEILEQTEFVTKYESVQNMVNKCKLIVRGQDKINSFYIICNTLKCSPDAFLISTKETVSLFDEFTELFKQGKASYVNDNSHTIMKSGDNTSVSRYSKALRKFLSSNDKPLPENIGGNLSGKKENYGAYSTVKLSDTEYFAALKFMGEIDDGHNDEWRALTAFTHDAYPRPSTTMKYEYLMKPVEKVVDDVVTLRLADRIYEPKQTKHFPKWVFRKESVDALQYVSHGKRLINHIGHVDAKKLFAKHLREFYHSIGKMELNKKYMKGIDVEPYYFNERPIHSLRHSGAHFSMRNSGFNATVVQKFGWDDPAMITQVYAEMADEEILDDGVCHYCNPPKIDIPNSDRLFCSLRHSLAYHSNGQKAR